MSRRRSLAYAGLTLSVAALAFSLGTVFTHRAFAQRLADSDVRMTMRFDHMARSILQIRQTQAGPDGATGRVSTRSPLPARPTRGMGGDRFIGLPLWSGSRGLRRPT